MPMLFLQKSRIAFACMGLLCLMGLTACESEVVRSVPALVKLQGLMGEPVDIAKVNYTAADQLAYQSNANISRDTEITVTRIYDMNNVNSDVLFAYVVPQHVGTRLVQLGYNVRLSNDGDVKAVADVVPSGDDRIRGWKRQKATLGGSYRLDGSDVYINLKMVEDGTNKLLGAYEYKMRRTSDVAKMLVPPPAAKTVLVSTEETEEKPIMPEKVLHQALPPVSINK